MMRAFEKRQAERAPSGAFHAPLRCIEFAGVPRLLDLAVAEVIASRTVHPVRFFDCSMSGASFQSGFAYAPCDWNDGHISNLFLAELASVLPQLRNASTDDSRPAMGMLRLCGQQASYWT